MEEFTNTTVPRVVDEQSGAVTRKLQKAHETFDIENAKIAKREQKVPVPYPFLPLPLAIALWCRSGRLAVGSVGGWVGGRVGVIVTRHSLQQVLYVSASWSISDTEKNDPSKKHYPTMYDSNKCAC